MVTTRMAKPEASNPSRERTAAFWPAVIGIEAERDFIHIVFQDTAMIGGQSRALRGDNVFHTRHEAGD